MFDYSNLSDTEFEKLCSNVMERILNVNLRYFSPGKDGGIDLVDKLDEKNIIVQVKHYDKSSYSNLKSSLLKEMKKVENLNPKQYYICTSQSLTPLNVNEIFTIFNAYMDSDKNIITKNELDKFLQNSENVDILRKNFKLWLTADKVLTELLNESVFIDGEVLLFDLEKDFKYFVPTLLFEECIEVLENERKLLIYGEPGVGKTLNSKMLALYFVKKGYRIRYTTNGDVDNIKRSLTANKSMKEVIFLDDCLGQYYFSLKENQDREIISLIKHVNLYENKIIILNSRITIFNEAKLRSDEFKQYFENENIKIRKINMSAVSITEKALIFYNHLLKNKVSNEYYNTIRNGKKYLKIVTHNNYNPRIIDYVTTEFRYKHIAPENYFHYIMANLNNPQDVWKNEFDMRLTNVDRIFMSTLFSLTDTLVEIDVLKECFLKRIQNNTNLDSTVNIFDYTLERLNQSLIKVVDLNNQIMIGVLNPSINDYLTNVIWKNELGLQEIRNSIIYIEQLERCYKKDESIKTILEASEDGSLVELKSRDEEKVLKLLLWMIGTNQILKEEYKGIVADMGTLHFNVNFNGFQLTKGKVINYFLKDKSLFDFYNFNVLLKDNNFIIDLLKGLDLDDTVETIDQLIKILKENREYECYHNDFFKEILSNCINEYISTVDYYDFVDISSIDLDYKSIEIAAKEVEDKIDEKIGDILADLEELNIDDVDYDIYVDEDYIKELIQEEIRENSYDDWGTRHNENFKVEINEVDLILDRDINYV